MRSRSSPACRIASGDIACSHLWLSRRPDSRAGSSAASTPVSFRSMCRAVWVMVVGPTTDACKALRRAAGPDAQVVAMATSGEEAISLISSTPSDVVVLDAGLEGARGLISSLREKAPTAALIWVGDDPPERANASVPEPTDALEGAITRGLLAARAAR